MSDLVSLTGWGLVALLAGGPAGLGLWLGALVVYYLAPPAQPRLPPTEAARVAAVAVLLLGPLATLVRASANWRRK